MALHCGGPFVVPGDVITTESGFLWGHGTLLDDHDKRLRATVAGFVDQVNKLLTVRPLNQRYAGEIGDVVVGRITGVGDKRWKVDVNARQDGVLMLSAIHLPGGVQRRRTHEDSLQMREFFAEGDLISAEVQNFYADGAVALHTRTSKYGRLNRGIFVAVRQTLVKRCKQHFVRLLGAEIEIILGNNGYIWISESDHPADVEFLQRMARVRQSIVALDRMFVAIFPDTIMDVFNDSVEMGLSPQNITDSDQIQLVTQKAVLRQQQL